jgi:hypothetical protein
MKLLKTPDGKRWSRKNITWAACLCIMVLIIAWGSYSANWPPEYIFTGLVTLIILVLTGTIVDKKLSNKNNGNEN